MAIKRQTKERASHIGAVAFCTLIYAILFLPIVIVVVNSLTATSRSPISPGAGFPFIGFRSCSRTVRFSRASATP